MLQYFIERMTMIRRSSWLFLSLCSFVLLLSVGQKNYNQQHPSATDNLSLYSSATFTGTTTVDHSSLIYNPDTESHRAELMDDMIFTKFNEPGKDGRTAIWTARKWPVSRDGNVWVPYRFTSKDANYLASARSVLSTVAADLAATTCIRLKEYTAKTYPRPHVRIGAQSSCLSVIGRGSGSQYMSLDPLCLNKAVVSHEFLHALGFVHEQMRPDRDDYVIVHRENIRKGNYKWNFDKVNPRLFDTMQLPFDFSSVMLYPQYSWGNSIDINKPVISPLPQFESEAVNMGQRQGLSFIDIAKINAAYCPHVLSDESSSLPNKTALWDHCELATDPGSCSTQIRFYFNGGLCTSFPYRGVGGNRNNFATKTDCISQCSTARKPFCTLSLDEGKCRKVRRWYYDIQRRKCLRFFYFGSGGNLNNFETQKECLQSCSVGRYGA